MTIHCILEKKKKRNIYKLHVFNIKAYQKLTEPVEILHNKKIKKIKKEKKKKNQEKQFKKERFAILLP